MTLRALRTAPLLLLCMASCDKDGGTPGFVHLTTPEVRNADGSVVIPSSITDLWVYANDEPVGVWQVGRRVPVLAEGSTNLKIVAGIRRNGITDDRIQYPFLATSIQEVVIEPGEEITLRPEFRYYEEVPVYEDFESQSTPFEFGTGDTVFVAIDADTADVISGQRAGAILLDPSHAMFRAVSTQDPPFNNGASPASLEIDYRSDTRFLVGVKFDLNGQTYEVPYVHVSPTRQSDGSMPWRHIYVDLGSAWGTGGSYNRQFYLLAALEGGATSARIIMDNIRVVY